MSVGFILAPPPYRMVNAGSCDYKKKKKKKKKMTIKSEQVEVYIVDFINAVKANIHASKPLIPEIIKSGSSIQRLQDK